MKKISDMTVEDVRSVYVGKRGKCACGCAGKHYNAQHRDEASKNRGYPVKDGEIKEWMMMFVLDVVQHSEKHKEEAARLNRSFTAPVDNGDHVSWESDKKLYVVYRTNKAMSDAT